MCRLIILVLVLLILRWGWVYLLMKASQEKILLRHLQVKEFFADLLTIHSLLTLAASLILVMHLAKMVLLPMVLHARMFQRLLYRFLFLNCRKIINLFNKQQIFLME